MQIEDIVKAVQVLQAKKVALDEEKSSIIKRIEEIDDLMGCITQTIHALDPSYSPRKFRYRKTQAGYRFFKHGECANVVLKIIRESPDAITSTTIIRKILLDKGYSDNQETFKAIASTVSVALNKLRVRGIITITGVSSNGTSHLWKIST